MHPVQIQPQKFADCNDENKDGILSVSYFNHIQACNNFNPAAFLPFIVDGVVVGQIKHGFSQLLCEWPNVFVVSNDAVELATKLDTFTVRSEAVAKVLSALADRGVLSHLHGEQYVVTATTREQGLFLIDRAAATCFGVRAFGQHINGFVRSEQGIELWVAKRSADRHHFPGKLDNLVAGGLPHGITLQENLKKECWEEAGIPPELAAAAQPVGAVTYNAETAQGYKPDTLYCYDLELTADFQPQCTDGEVESFSLWPIEKVMQTVRDTNEFKPNCNLVIIDFLIRHGVIEPEDGDSVSLPQELRPPFSVRYG